MALEDRDRRRLLMALLLTTVTVPLIWWATSSRSSDDATPAATDATGQFTDRPNLPPRIEPGELPPVFLDGPRLERDPSPVEIAVPAPPAGEVFAVTATYRSTIDGTDRCLVTSPIPTGRTVTILNLDNNRTTTCTTSPAPAAQTDPIVLHTTRFSELADLTDAPIPVEVRL